jgi:hypothetical protein
VSQPGGGSTPDAGGDSGDIVTDPADPDTPVTNDPKPHDGPVDDGDTDGRGLPADPRDEYSRVPELAPIDGLDLLIRESYPPQYALEVVSGVPSGCAEYARTDVTREGNTIVVEVWNSVINDPAVSCTMIYGIHEQVVDLGSDFTPGEEYTVKVNDQELTFVAQ